MDAGWQTGAVIAAVLAAAGYLIWKMFRKGGSKGCGKCSSSENPTGLKG